MQRPIPQIRIHGHWKDSHPGEQDNWITDGYEVSLDGGVTWESAELVGRDG